MKPESPPTTIHAYISGFPEDVQEILQKIRRIISDAAADAEEAIKYHVLPIDDRTIERFDAIIAGRPDLMNGRTKLELYKGAVGIPENAFINMKNTSFKITADVQVAANTNGVILCQGGDFGGWAFYMLGNKPSFTYNFVGLELFTVNSTQKIPAGKHTLTFDFAYDGGRVQGEWEPSSWTARRSVKAGSARPISIHSVLMSRPMWA
jgi:hypothetical protein